MMPVERTMIFCNAKAYRLDYTILALHAQTQSCYDLQDWTKLAWLESAKSKCSDLRWDQYIDLEDFVCHVKTGVETPLSMWFEEFGVEASYTHEQVFIDESGDELLISSVGSWVCSDDEGFTLDGEECISNEEEVELVIGVHILMELSNEFGDNVASF
jgi:hypothetical protein